MGRWSVCVLVSLTVAGCAPSLRPGSRALERADNRTIVHVLNRITFGPRPGAVDRVRTMGLSAYIAGQLHPEGLNDGPVEARLARLPDLQISSPLFAADFYLPMIAARRVFTDSQKVGAAALPRLGWHLL